ncbi:glycosyltransferase family 4 protein [Massilia sp. R2A-15]|uniref:glycosyltransferase family 4 protein n=1 Tax=Massilia sp. R2A-15 TaxID=3064278 RepID=UPI002735E743|nr:glycosyltransferase family 4 protein [Massilia sp. R2A-15]WLI88917.1 glycosyltransferase family 4 protein [Massilia sp. R2A-15]
MVLGFTGFVREWHGHGDVITMIAEDPPDARRQLLMVGDGPVRAAMEQQARELGIADRVRFTGIIGRDEVARYFAAFDIALQPAETLFEYLALGKAIVGSAQPNIIEILQPDYNALLFDPAAPSGLAGAIARLSADPVIRTTVAANARATIGEQQLTWQANAEPVVALFRGLMPHACGPVFFCPPASLSPGAHLCTKNCPTLPYEPPS